MLKKHPFFEGVNFKEVSKPSYKALKSLVKEILPVDCNKDPLNLSNDPRESDL